MTVVIKSVNVKINEAELKRFLAHPFREDMKMLSEEFKVMIRDGAFPWNGTKTFRQNGEIAGSPRNIYDLGNFLKSQKLAIRTGSATFTWGVPYASVIFYGASFENGNSIPGRDWITPTINFYYPLKFFKQTGRVSFS